MILSLGTFGFVLSFVSLHFSYISRPVNYVIVRQSYQDAMPRTTSLKVLGFFV